MKFEPGRWKKTATAAPMRTLQEMAEEFGIPWKALVQHMRRSTVPRPEAARTTNTTTAAGVKSYYRPKEMREWWEKHNAARNAQ